MHTIGRYIIRGLLGRGGMGKVYKVELPMIGRIAALKLLDPDALLIKLMGREHLRALFLKEARTMAGLQHPNIVGIQDFDEANGRLFYIMDFFANNLGTMMGETYQVERPSRRIGVEIALDYTRQTLQGLACLHDAGIIHRDIKPFNLLITAWDQLRICDFGLSKLRGERFAGPSNLNVGSPYYAAPEQEQAPDKVDPRADLYPVGIMLYRMLSGLLPEQRPDRNGYRPLAALHPDLDEHWDAFIARAIDPRPTQRFPDTQAMLQALDDLTDRWQKHKTRTCALAPTAKESAHKAAERQPLRDRPLKVRPGQANAVFSVDALWRPLIYCNNVFEDRPEGLVVDYATDLVWQRAGSAYPCPWQRARDYVDRLNREGFAGLTRWRLPTIAELISLLRQAAHGEALCIAPLFDPTQRWLWSADRSSFMAAYYVDIELGFVAWQDFSAPYYVRAVCSRAPLKPEP